MTLDQIGIMFTGAFAVWLTQDRRQSWRRWACIFGMIGQPFWYYSAYQAAQWGVLIVSILYTYGWARGIWTNWIKPIP